MMALLGLRSCPVAVRPSGGLAEDPATKECALCRAAVCPCAVRRSTWPSVCSFLCADLSPRVLGLRMQRAAPGRIYAAGLKPGGPPPSGAALSRAAHMRLMG